MAEIYAKSLVLKLQGGEGERFLATVIQDNVKLLIENELLGLFRDGFVVLFEAIKLILDGKLKKKGLLAVLLNEIQPLMEKGIEECNFYEAITGTSMTMVNSDIMNKIKDDK